MSAVYKLVMWRCSRVIPVCREQEFSPFTSLL